MLSASALVVKTRMRLPALKWLAFGQSSLLSCVNSPFSGGVGGGKGDGAGIGHRQDRAAPETTGRCEFGHATRTHKAPPTGLRTHQAFAYESRWQPSGQKTTGWAAGSAVPSRRHIRRMSRHLRAGVTKSSNYDGPRSATSTPISTRFSAATVSWADACLPFATSVSARCSTRHQP